MMRLALSRVKKVALSDKSAIIEPREKRREASRLKVRPHVSHAS